MGDDYPMAKCKDDFNEFGYLFCQGSEDTFKFNRKNGRFLSVYAFGYFNVLPEVNEITDKSSATPSMEIGKCSPS